jgi:hypothetical protein
MLRKTDGSALIKGPDSTDPALLIRMAIGPRAACAGERGGDGAADAAAAAGHESMLARKGHGLASGRPRESPPRIF